MSCDEVVLSSCLDEVSRPLLHDFQAMLDVAVVKFDDTLAGERRTVAMQRAEVIDRFADLSGVNELVVLQRGKENGVSDVGEETN